MLLKVLRVKFTELYEVEGAFGQESVSPGGGIFPKHLIYSYDIHTKTVVFPFGWMTDKSSGTSKCPHRLFYFTSHQHTLINRELVKKIDFVEVDYEPKDFEPDPKLVMMTLTIPRRNKSRVNKLIQQYQATKTIVAKRSKESTKIISTFFSGKKKDTEKTLLKHTYELILMKSKWKVFVKQLFEQKLIPTNDRYAILLEENVFPKQLAYFSE